jgi:hypothetical protein
MDGAALFMIQKQVKSKKRVADHGEVFTADREVNAMLDLVKTETERIDSRFLEPACGNGNFRAEIMRRKLAAVKKQYGKNPADFELLVSLNVFNSRLMNESVYMFKRYEDASLNYTGINRHANERVGLYDTALSREDYAELPIRQKSQKFC